MPKYLWQASCATKGVKGIAETDGSSRRDAVQRATESVDGKMEAFYFAFGELDACVFVDLPDSETVAALALAVNGTGCRRADGRSVDARRTRRRKLEGHRFPAVTPALFRCAELADQRRVAVFAPLAFRGGPRRIS